MGFERERKEEGGPGEPYGRLASEARDVHAERPARPLGLDRVGSIGVRVPLRVPEGMIVPAEVDLLVDLPPGRRGVDLSRQVLALLEASAGASGGLDLARRAAEAASSRLPYARSVEVRVRYSGLIPRGPNSSPEPYWAEAAVLSRAGSRREELSVTVLGTTACPCTQELLRALAEMRGMPPGVPAPTHTQRASATLTVSSRDVSGIGEGDLVGVLERGLSSPVRSALKRPQEARLVESMLENPRLVEDAAREIMWLAADLPLPEDAEIRVSVRTQESVHGHDLLAEGRATVADVRAASGA